MVQSLLDKINSGNAEQAADVVRQLLPAYLARRKEDPLAFFKYSSDGQRAFASSQAYGRVAIAGNHGGKSWIGAAESSRFVLGRHPHRRVPVNGKVWVGARSNAMQKDVHQKVLLKFIPESRIVHVEKQGDLWEYMVLVCNACNIRPDRTKKKTLTTWLCPGCYREAPFVGFRTYEQAFSQWQADNIDGIWFDEEPPLEYWEEGIARTIGRPWSAWWLTYTPVLSLAWIREQLIEKPVPDKLEVFKWSTYDNKSLTDEDIRKVEDQYADPLTRKQRMEGEYILREGLIFKDWDPLKNEIDVLPAEFFTRPTDGSKPLLRPDLDIWGGIDTGGNFAVELAFPDYDLGTLYVFAEVFSFDEDTHERVKQIKAELAKWGIDFSRVRWLLDPTSQFLRELGREGISPWKPDHGAKVARDATIGYMLAAQKPERKKPGLKVHRINCPRVIKERMYYQWAPPKQSGPLAGVAIEEPLKKDDHCLDALMLICEQHPVPSRRAEKIYEELSPIERDRAQVRQEVNERKAIREEGLQFDMDPLAGVGGGEDTEEDF